MNLADIVRNEFDRDTISYVRKKTANKREGEKIVTFTIPEEAKKSYGNIFPEMEN